MDKGSSKVIAVSIRKNLKRYAERITGPCSALIADYAQCVVSKGIEVKQNECDKEFHKYIQCVKAKH